MKQVKNKEISKIDKIIKVNLIKEINNNQLKRYIFRKVKNRKFSAFLPSYISELSQSYHNRN